MDSPSHKVQLSSVLDLTQSLPPIPDNCHFSFKLTYYNDVTPRDYEPSSFVPGGPVLPRVPAGTRSLQCGKVASGHWPPSTTPSASEAHQLLYTD